MGTRQLWRPCRTRVGGAHLGFAVVVLVRVVRHVFTKDVPRVLLRGHQIGRLPFVISDGGKLEHSNLKKRSHFSETLKTFLT